MSGPGDTSIPDQSHDATGSAAASGGLSRRAVLGLGAAAAGAAAVRPQEMLSLHVAEAMVQSMNRFAGGAPVTGRALDFLISTGDNADNTQYNEVRWHIDILDGRQPVRPDSGNYGRWEGVGGTS